MTCLCYNVTMMHKRSQKKKKSFARTVFILIGLILMLSVTALFPEVCDKYADNVYCILCDCISHVTAPIPFALGEVIMFIGAGMLVFSLILILLLLFLGKKAGYRDFCKAYFKTFITGLLIVILIYVPTWFIPFCGTVLGRGNTELRTEFTYDEIYDLLTYIVEQGNAAAEEIYIAEDGSVDFPTAEERLPHITEALQALGSEYSRLTGYYPPVKEALCSDILERMGIGGYNYPYTMEPTHNRYMSPLWSSVLDAHELAHHKGYYKENEANFLSQLALIRSDDPYLKLAAAFDMYDYVSEDYYETRNKEIERLQAEGKIGKLKEVRSEEELLQLAETIEELFGPEPEFSKRVWQIYNAGEQIEQQLYEEDIHVIDEMPAVDEVIHTTADKGWEMQAEILQENCYDGVTLLLLQYFYGGDDK